jgi:hypothetical protein
VCVCLVPLVAGRLGVEVWITRHTTQLNNLEIKKKTISVGDSTWPVETSRPSYKLRCNRSERVLKLFFLCREKETIIIKNYTQHIAATHSVTCKLGSSRQIRTNRHNNNNQRREEEEKELRTSRILPRPCLYVPSRCVWRGLSFSSTFVFELFFIFTSDCSLKKKKTLARARSSSFSYFGYAQRRVYIFIIWLFLVVVWKRWARVCGRHWTCSSHLFLNVKLAGRRVRGHLEHTWWGFQRKIKKEQDEPPHNKI